MTPRFKCDTCLGITETPVEMTETAHFAIGDATISQPTTFLRCDAIGCKGECDEVVVCDECQESEIVEGSEQCLRCLCDYIVREPAEIDGLSSSLRAVVAKELARRCRLWFVERQAA